MSAQKPTFRVMKNGYDRFAVDDAMENYANQIEQLQQKIDVYQKQLVQTTQELEALKKKYQELSGSVDAQKQTSDEIARLALREANSIIENAQQNADEIIRDALGTARTILVDLSRLYEDAGNVKSQMYDQLNGMLRELDEFQIPRMPDLRWLDEAEKKMR